MKIKADTARTSQRGLLPNAVKTRQLDTQVVKNGEFSQGTFSISDGSIITLTITVNAKEGNRLAIAPLGVLLFQDSIATANQIPDGDNLSTGDYIMTQTAVPSALRNETTYPGNDGNNAVFKVWLDNETGDTQTIVYTIQSRFISSAGLDE